VPLDLLGPLQRHKGGSRRPLGSAGCTTARGSLYKQQLPRYPPSPPPPPHPNTHTRAARTCPIKLAGTTTSEHLMGTGSESADTLCPSSLDTAQPRGAGLDSTSISVCSVLPCDDGPKGVAGGLR
jgi:hypothetical protein